ncbi:hypothetical protein BGW42_008756 [Actinomortierella wolfii]|nr:hypothetical protein BGW42_008756 [Actinomortierella wolfii]
MQSERVYELPVSNIAYHVYLAEEDAAHLHHVSQQAFRRTLDTYSEYEALAERFQVELERREAILKEQREQEKLRRQQERSKHSSSSHNHHHHSHQRLRARNSHEHLGAGHYPFSTSASSTGRGRGRSAQLAAISAEAAAAAEAALSQPSDRSFSASPALPQSPSPRLVPMNASDGAVAGIHQHRHQQQQQDDVGGVGKETTGFSDSNGGHELSSHPLNGSLVSARTLRKKRKQTIPVSQLIVSRIPGITLRLQAEKQGDALQVEIVKNVEDYNHHSASIDVGRLPLAAEESKASLTGILAESMSPPSASADIHQQRTENTIIGDGSTSGGSDGVDNEDVAMADSQVEMSSYKSTSAKEGPMEVDSTEQDLQKVRESIESGRRRAYSFLQEAVEAYQDPDEDQDDISTIAQHRRGHGFRAGISSRARGRSHSASPVSLPSSRGTMPLADPYSTLLPSAAGSYLPLSWENFSARDCVVNKVIGKHDKDLDELEEVVQEAITRQQQYQQQLLEEQRSHSGGSETPQQQSEQTSGTHGSRHSSPHHYPSKREKHEHHNVPSTITTRSHGAATMRHRRTPSNQNGRNVTPPAHDSELPTNTSATRSTGTPRSSRHRQGETGTISTRRGGNHDSLLHYDDIERILQEKRRKKRIEKMRQSSKASSGNGDEDEDEGVGGMRQMSVESDSTAATKEDTTTAMAVDEPLANDSPNVSSGRAKGARSKRSMSFSGASSSRQDGESKAEPSYKRERRNSSAIHMRTDHATTRTGRSGQPSDRTEPSTASNSSSSEAEDETDLDYKHKGRQLNNIQPRAGPSSSEGLTQRPITPTTETLTRRRVRTNATLPMLELASAGGDGNARKVEANFFDAALEMISRKRRDVLAKRRAAKLAEEAEAEAALQAAKTELEEKMQAAEAEKQRVADQEKRLEELRAQKIESSNLPKSSKILPGRVRRRPPRGVDDAGYLPDACTSCQLSLTELDKTSWKEAQEAKSIQLPKTWGAHAVLCSACRLQYSIHHTRCTQCFYVPVQEELSASPRCLRCRSGTWLKELLVPSAPGSNVMDVPVIRPGKRSDRSTSVSRRSSLAGGGMTAEEDNADEGHPAHD